MVAGYYVFMIIAPFFLLGVYKAPYREIAFEQGPYYFYALGWVAAVVTWLMPLVAGLLPIPYMLALIQFARTRKWWIAVILALAPLPIAWVNAGPYAAQISGWTWIFPD